MLLELSCVPVIAGAIILERSLPIGGNTCTLHQKPAKEIDAQGDNNEVAVIIEQLRLVNSYTSFTVAISRFQGQRSEIETIEGKNVAQNLLGLIAHGGAQEAGLYSYEELQAEFENALAVARAKPSDVDVWEETFRITRSYKALVQRKLSVGGLGNQARTPSCNIIYDPDNDQISLLNLNSGPVFWDTFSLMQPLALTPENLERLATCQWAHEPFAPGGMIHRFTYTGIEGYGEIVTNADGILVAISSHFGSSFKRTARFKLEHVKGEDSQIGLKGGLYVGTHRGLMNAYSFAVTEVSLRDKSKDVYLEVPTSAKLFDFRAGTKYYRPNSLETWPPEIREYVRLVDHPHNEPPLDRATKTAAPMPPKAPGVQPSWKLVAIGIAIGVFSLLVARAIYTRLQRGS